MQKQLVALSLVLVMFLGIAAQASGPAKMPFATPDLSFDKATAICTIYVRADESADSISVKAKLWSGNTCLKTWLLSGKGLIREERTTTVSRGKTYKLTLDYTINGITQPQKSVTRTCP